MSDLNETIFGKKYLNKLINSTPSFAKYLDEHRATLTRPIKKWLGQLEQGTIKDEESFQDPFTDAIFKEVLGYTRQGDSTPWTCTREYKVFEGKSADIALGFFEKGEKENQTTFVVGEYKSPAACRDLSRKPSAQGMSPVDQAFNYAQRVGIQHCHWIIVSNMDEIRLYHSSSMEKYESFRIAELASNASEFDRFYFLLSRKHLLPEKPSDKSFIDTLYEKNQADQAEINKKFYAVYSQARQNLFEDLIADNPETDKLHLLEKVQKILDRFLFMCFCEDKGYIGNVGESDPLTKRIFVNAMDSFTGSMWNEFLGIAKAIDRGSEKPIRIPPYDGGLFSPDPELEKLNVGNDAFAHLQPLAAYDFESELDVNILGHVFEQSVSDIEELKASINNEDFDKKKGKRKKQGIYYTPAYITGFIIEQTIGAWIEREKEKLGFANLPAISEDEDKLLSSAEADKKSKLEKALKEKATLHGNAWTKLQENLLSIRVLDPACGSGAFLNKAFWYLVKQHNQIYSQRQHYGAAENLKDFNITRVDYHIVKNNLYGVDLSKESVEITKLSLWLQLVYHKEKLPALEGSIHYGDSIVSDPNYSKAAFDWQGNFPNIVQFEPETCNQLHDFGFDVVIGNPPYVRQEFLSPVKPALQTIYGSFYNGVADLYTYFYKRGFQLLKPGGYLGFITSSTFTKTGSGVQTRTWLQDNVTINSFVDFGILQLWEGDAANLVCILVGQNKVPTPDHYVNAYKITSVPDVETEKPFDDCKPIFVQQSNLGVDSWNFDRPEVEALRTKIFSKGKPLKEVVGSPLYGIKTGLNEAFIIDKVTRDRLIKEESKSAELIKPFLVGRDLKQWHYDFADRYLIAIQKGFTKQWAAKDIDEAEGWKVLQTKYPAIANQLKPFEEKAKKRQDQGDFWWELRACDYYKSFEEPKIVYPEFMIIPKFTIDLERNYFNNKVYFLSSDKCFISSILSSRIIWFVIKQRCAVKLGNVFELFTIYVENFPIVEPQGCEDDPATDKGKLAKLAKTAQEKAFKRLEYRKGFLGFVANLLNHNSKGTVEDDDVSEGSAINRWDTLSWNEFIKAASSPSAFGKQFDQVYKQTLVQMDLKSNFEQMKQLCNKLTIDIHTCERQINEIVYRLYELTPDEVKLLEELTGNIYED